jgi:hypothetical protein
MRRLSLTLTLILVALTLLVVLAIPQIAAAGAPGTCSNSGFSLEHTSKGDPVDKNGNGWLCFKTTNNFFIEIDDKI